jgi:hypothetical protein
MGHPISQAKVERISTLKIHIKLVIVKNIMEKTQFISFFYFSTWDYFVPL